MEKRKRILVILIVVLAAVVFIAAGFCLHKRFVTDRIMDGGDVGENSFIGTEETNKKSITAVVKKDAKFGNANLNLNAEDFTNCRGFYKCGICLR